jgi:aminoglycoside phosphotransferase (APT) family kinase protein
MTEPPPPRMPFVTGLLQSVLDQHRDELTVDYVAAASSTCSTADRVDALWNGGPQTYIHGDTHIGNVFVDGKRVGFHDWGLSRVSTPLRDVSYFLTMSVDPEERRRSERDLLRTYLGALRAAGGPQISLDEAYAAHRVQAGYTVLATFLAFHALVRGRRRARHRQESARARAARARRPRGGRRDARGARLTKCR